MSLSREQMLVEMGISPIWVTREMAAEAPSEEGIQDDAAKAPGKQASSSALPRAGREPGSFAATASGSPSHQVFAGESVSAPIPANAEVATADWPLLERLIAECRACPLCQQRKQAVPGVGDRQPEWLFIGEGPGAEEDARGEPFVGQAGKLLDAMLASLDIARGDRVYIANAVKCRPPGNRTPEAAEMAACRPYLERQIALLKPRIIVLLGKAAVHAVLGGDASLASMRGKRFEYAGIPVAVTYHPAYLLRNLPDKAKAWEDLLFARRLLRAAQGGE